MRHVVVRQPILLERQVYTNSAGGLLTSKTYTCACWHTCRLVLHPSPLIMSLSILLPQLLLPRRNVELGRFTASVEQPHQNYHDPGYGKSPEAVVSARHSFAGFSEQGTTSSFASALTSLMSAGFSRRAKTRLRVDADAVRTYTLDNSEEWFNEAASLVATRRWIERTVDKGYDIYMITAFHTVTNSRIAQEQTCDSGTDGQISIPISLSLASVGALVPLSDILDPAIGGTSSGFTNVRTCFEAPGEQVCAFQYRKVRYRWLSSNNIDKWRLSKSPRWSCLERGRDEEDGEDDIIEVDTGELEQLDGEWERREAGDEVLLARVDNESAMQGGSVAAPA
ncbi:hypothetical protein SODALDRAFT_188594 [Sodiomyces alkalinus F11]|uniref:Uncharacterized protein n=1 Tax=Sodiomyces alkalinus (strain CBS 110278 / VKM F-3762 / F11) TaxID=1314773 RepID=A0A3N2PRR9_SODAK|nr:hypothetical protein SODALDRAFT_188594 [Sodiomyces alkalinus F11]ROT37124.1 hypothetical protein SODALDRAFT_188594 [Sodiomyces alkalinus F11]